MTNLLIAGITDFLASAASPVLLEAGEEALPLAAGRFSLEPFGTRAVLQVWSDSRTLTRRVVSVTRRSAARLDLEVERFGKKTGMVAIVDQARPSVADPVKRAGRLALREKLREFLHRQFAGWTVAQLTAETDLEHSLSPVYPRALVRQGGHGWAAIASPAGVPAADGALAAGLIWLDHLRMRERRVMVEGLAMFLAEGSERTTCLRVECMNPAAARICVFTYNEEGESLAAPRTTGESRYRGGGSRGPQAGGCRSA
ncbi:MAG: hypothetical protein FJW39_11055 [Acidobacteria bacterium]|nr:hypothetical protein [Acidobacteriota bacterium]